MPGIISTSIEDDQKKNRSLCGCILCFVLWLFPFCLVIGTALYFSPNRRTSDIAEFNNRANSWVKSGKELFEGNNFTLYVNEEDYPLEEIVVKPDGIHPAGDKCNLEGDPVGGCVSCDVVYFEVEVPVPKDNSKLSLKLVHEGNIVMNDTIATSTTLGTLSRICFRVHDNETTFVLDNPPVWSLYMNEGELGCEFSNSWEPLYYEASEHSTLKFQVRYYQDPFVSASSITRGCSERDDASNCFGITKKEMTNYGLYIIIGAGGVTALEVIVLLIVCCVRKGNGESRPLL